MNPKSILESCRRAPFRRCSLLVGTRLESTGPTGTCIHRQVPVDSSAGSSSIRATLSTIQATTHDDDKTPKDNKSQKLWTDSELLKPIVEKPKVSIGKPSSLISKAHVSERNKPYQTGQTGPESHGLENTTDDSSTATDHSQMEGSASSSNSYAKFTKPSTTNTIAGDKIRNNNSSRNHRHHNKAKFLKTDQEYVTPGEPLMMPVLNHGARMTHTLPTLNASALFQKKQQVDSNTNATRQELLQVMRQETMPKRRRAFIMTGHGVPHQLLQDHLRMADSLLHREVADQCSFNNYHNHLTVDDWIRVRSREGVNRQSQIPADLHDSLELYLTVMNRLATHLALVFHDAPKKIGRWNVEFERQMAFNPQLLVHEDDEPLVSPIVEWVARNGINAPGEVIITLQGFGNPQQAHLHGSLRRRQPRLSRVTMVFAASFQSN